MPLRVLVNGIMDITSKFCLHPMGSIHIFGIPYSNDMNHPDNKGKPKGGMLVWISYGKTLNLLSQNGKLRFLRTKKSSSCLWTSVQSCAVVLKNQSILSKKIKPKPFCIYPPFNATYPPLCT